MFLRLLLIFTLCCLQPKASARLRRSLQVLDDDAQILDGSLVYEFHQVTNHFPNDTYYGPPPANQTFIQRYVVNDTFYKPGGPIFLFAGGEGSATDAGALGILLTGVIAELAQATNGMGLILEHRYYGNSIPVSNLSTDNLRWLTADQVIADLAYFAQHAQIPNHEDEDLTAPGRPWILYGGSLSGAETAFAVKTYPNIIYGGISSSGTVQASVTYPQWYYNIQKYAPQDCVRTVENIVDKIDHVIGLNDSAALLELKTIFGLEKLQDIRDFALTIAFTIGNPLFYPEPGWQERNWNPAVGSNAFFEFCGNLTSPNSPPNVTAVDKALAKYTQGHEWTHLGNYAEYIKRVIIPLCPEGSSLDSQECFGTHNQSYYANPLDFSANRAYLYQSCLEFGQFSQGAPAGRPSLLSRSIQADYSLRWCAWAFPPGEYNTIPSVPDVARWNKFGGVSLQADRLAQVDGAQDPWEYACVHSPDAKKRKNTLLRPYYEIPEGVHGWDIGGLLNISLEPDYIQKIHRYEIEFVKSWLADFGSWRNSTGS